VRKGEVTGRCKACAHAERNRIELLCANGQSFTAVARRFGLTKDVVNRHYANHVPPERKAMMLAGTSRLEDLKVKAEDEAASILDNLRYVRAVLYRGLDAAVETGDKYGIALLSDKIMACLRDTGRITGEIAKLSGGITVNNNLFISPEWRDAAQAIVAALRPFPEARLAVVGALRTLEDGRPALPAPIGRPAPVVIDVDAEPVADD